jgi:hypothetical protein
MTRSMLDAYKTFGHFLVKAINTVCHSSNSVYPYRLLKKTPYEFLTGKKPNVSYFHVFGSRCYVLNKISKSSKFAPRDYERFLLGYDSNS